MVDWPPAFAGVMIIAFARMTDEDRGLRSGRKGVAGWEHVAVIVLIVYCVLHCNVLYCIVVYVSVCVCVFVCLFVCLLTQV